MTKMLSSVLVVVFAILAQAIPAEAQSGRSRARSITRAIAGTDRYRGGYDRYGYDPYGPRDGRDVYGRKLPPIEVEECEYVECYGRKGTFHAEGGLFHFRAHDSTHNPFNVNHKNCIVIRSVGPTATQPSDQQAPSQVPVEAMPANQPVAGPANPLSGISWPTLNTTSFRAVVTDPNNGKQTLVVAGGSVSLPDPSGDQPYTVVLIEPGMGKSKTVPGEILPSKDLQGWEILVRKES